ncbi:uncharacterized protein LOC128858439 [Anastrepha ludens]|uniref:uncharacterized protein LOC128858439 n=1 Tax=Anastrepha ludens TaxID=28586 RepID=UPI0023AE7812|nr:uncharacterized protein LOC128858439 [Anastrepha ludens]
MKQILILAASALLLIQLVNALPHTKRESVAVAARDNPISQDASSASSEELSEESSEEDDPKLKLVAFTFGGMAVIAQWTLDKGSEVLKNAVKELNEIPDKDELLQANITRMSRIANENPQLTKEEDSEYILKLFEYLIDFSTLMDDYEQMPDDSKLKIALKTALESNGFNEFDSEFKNKIFEFAKSMERVFGEYIKEMTPAEKSKYSKLIQWYDEFKAETDKDKKLDKLGEFFDLI